MPSKNSRNPGTRPAGSILVTTAFPIPMRSMFWDRIFALAGWISLHTRSPFCSIFPARWVLFPPGAAQRSRIRSPRPGIQGLAHAWALGSWI